MKYSKIGSICFSMLVFNLVKHTTSGNLKIKHYFYSSQLFNLIGSALTNLYETDLHLAHTKFSALFWSQYYTGIKVCLNSLTTHSDMDEANST